MAYYGYVRTSKEQEADRRGMDPETQRRALIAAGLPERQVYDDIDVSGIAGVCQGRRQNIPVGAEQKCYHQRGHYLRRLQGRAADHPVR